MFTGINVYWNQLPCGLPFLFQYEWFSQLNYFFAKNSLALIIFPAFVSLTLIVTMWCYEK